MSQLNHTQSLAYVIGMLVGLQKHPEIYSLLVRELGSEEEAEKFSESLFKIGNSFYV